MTWVLLGILLAVGLVSIGSGLFLWPFLGAIVLAWLVFWLFRSRPADRHSDEGREIDQPRKRDIAPRRDQGSRTTHPEQHEEFTGPEGPPSASEPDARDERINPEKPRG